MSEEQSLERALSVVQTLHKRSRAGKVNWESSFSYPNGFEAEFGNLVVVIRPILDRDDPENPDYSLLVIQKPIGHVIGSQSSLGQVIDEISNITLRPVMDRVTPEGLNPYKVLSETYELARRKALKVDVVLDSLLQQLEGTGE